MNAALSIRPANQSEQKSLEALQLRASLMNENDRAALLANPDAITLPLDQIAAGRVFVAEQSGVIVGFAVVLPREDGDAELDGLFVEPASWRGGVGRALLNYAAEHAVSFGAAALHVVGNPHAAEFYKICGFEVLGRCETRFGPAITMRRDLLAAGGAALT